MVRGKSYFCKQWENNANYIIIDTDRVFGKTPCNNIYEIRIREEIIRLYGTDLEKILCEDVDDWYRLILNMLQGIGKIIVINSTMIRYIKDLSIIKGKVIILRTSINRCYKQCIQRFQERNPNASEEEIEEYSKKKKKIYNWYKYLNEFILKVDKL